MFTTLVGAPYVAAGGNFEATRYCMIADALLGIGLAITAILASQGIGGLHSGLVLPMSVGAGISLGIPFGLMVQMVAHNIAHQLAPNYQTVS